MMDNKILGIVGSYRKGRVIDTAVTEILKGAESRGAETSKIYLTEKQIEFCTNCRSCTQEKDINGNRGICVQDDEMEQILAEIDASDAVVLGSPINVSTVTAVMKRFIERLIVYSYWPWGTIAPKFRTKQLNKKAVIVTSSAAPAFIGRIIMPNSLSVLKTAAKCMGAKVVQSLYFGMAAETADSKLNEKSLRKAFEAGQKLVS